jgi:hypothetical protein
MAKSKLIASHYTIAQMTRILGINYNRVRSVLGRVPGCRVTIFGTPMIAVEDIPKLRAAAKEVLKARP